jgi:hypothetical protein
MVVLTALFAAIHWQGYFESSHYVSAVLIDTVPFILLALTAPFTQTARGRQLQLEET